MPTEYRTVKEFNSDEYIVKRSRFIGYAKPVTTKITRKEISVKDRIHEIRNYLNVKGKVEFTELFDILTKENVVVTFLSLLDMSKNNEINLTQKKNFSSIYIEKM